MNGYQHYEWALEYNQGMDCQNERKIQRNYLAKCKRS